MRIKIIFVFAILSIIKTSAQSDFRSGYIVKNNNDTVYGLIDYRGNKTNARECHFRQDEKSEVVKYLPSEISTYRFTDSKYYVSKSVNTGEKEEQIFLEYLINGIVSIYYYSDMIGDHYFAEKEKGKLINLKNESKEVIIDATKYTRETKEYVGILKYLLRDSPTVLNEVNNATLNRQALIKLASDYHYSICSDKSCIIYERKPTKVKFEFGPLIGYNIELITARSKAFAGEYYFRNSKFTTADFPAFGFFVKSNMPFISECLFVQYEGTFAKSTAKSVAPVNVFDMTFEEFFIERQAYNQSLIFRYEFPRGIIRPAFQFGFFANKYADNTHCIETLHFLDGSTYYNSSHYLYGGTMVDFGLSLGMGFSTTILKRNAHLDVRYQPNISYDRGMGLLPNLNSTTFLVNLSMSILK